MFSQKVSFDEMKKYFDKDIQIVELEEEQRRLKRKIDESLREMERRINESARGAGGNKVSAGEVQRLE
jgi:hypothetical protein